MDAHTHSVLTSKQLLIGQGRSIQKVTLSELPRTIADVCNLANTYKVTHVWVLPGVEIEMNVGSEWDIFSTYDEYNDDNKPLPDSHVMFTRIWKKGDYSGPRGGVKVGFPEYGNWGWIVDSPVTILATIFYLEQVLGVIVEWSPGHMGTELVTHLNRTAKRQEWVRESTVDLNVLPFKKAARDIVWKVDRLEVLPGCYLIQYDKRSAYLSACPGVYVGAGDPWHVTCIDNSIDTSLPGIYRVTADKAESIFDDNVLPPIITTEWITDDVLNYAMEKGYRVTVHECYQWTEKHKTLESYATKLWTSRRAFREDVTRFPHAQARENAENTMKEVALVATGKFASRKTSRFLRPDWWAKVVGKTRTNIMRNLHKFFQQGFTPVLIYSDSVYFVSDTSDPRAAIPGILDREKELGGFRHEGTWKVTPEMIEVFRTEKPGKVQKFLEHTPKVEVTQ